MSTHMITFIDVYDLVRKLGGSAKLVAEIKKQVRILEESDKKKVKTIEKRYTKNTKNTKNIKNMKNKKCKKMQVTITKLGNGSRSTGNKVVRSVRYNTFG